MGRPYRSPFYRSKGNEKGRPYRSSGEVDGRFGPGTKEAVVAFQAANGLDTDGMAGEETLNLLNSGNAKRAE